MNNIYEKYTAVDWKGCLIKVKKEWMDPNERDIPYLVIEDRDDKILVQMLKEYANPNRAFLDTWCWAKDWCYIIDKETRHKLN